MAKQIRLRAEQINSTFIANNVYSLNTAGHRVVSISITNSPLSPGNLLIGLNEDPTDKVFLQAGESMPFGPFRTDDYLNDNEIRAIFDSNDMNNQALVVVTTEGEKPLDC